MLLRGPTKLTWCVATLLFLWITAVYFQHAGSGAATPKTVNSLAASVRGQLLKHIGVGSKNNHASKLVEGVGLAPLPPGSLKSEGWQGWQHEVDDDEDGWVVDGAGAPPYAQSMKHGGFEHGDEEEWDGGEEGDEYDEDDEQEAALDVHKKPPHIGELVDAFVAKTSSMASVENEPAPLLEVEDKFQDSSSSSKTNMEKGGLALDSSPSDSTIANDKPNNGKEYTGSGSGTAAAAVAAAVERPASDESSKGVDHAVKPSGKKQPPQQQQTAAASSDKSVPTSQGAANKKGSGTSAPAAGPGAGAGAGSSSSSTILEHNTAPSDDEVKNEAAAAKLADKVATLMRGKAAAAASSDRKPNNQKIDAAAAAAMLPKPGEPIGSGNRKSSGSSSSNSGLRKTVNKHGKKKSKAAGSQLTV